MCKRCEPLLQRMQESSENFRQIAELEEAIHQRCAPFIDQLSGARNLFVSPALMGELRQIATQQRLLFEKELPDLPRLALSVPTLVTLFGVPIAADPLLPNGAFRVVPAFTP